MLSFVPEVTSTLIIRNFDNFSNIMIPFSSSAFKAIINNKKIVPSDNGHTTQLDMHPLPFRDLDPEESASISSRISHLPWDSQEQHKKNTESDHWPRETMGPADDNFTVGAGLVSLLRLVAACFLMADGQRPPGRHIATMGCSRESCSLF